MVKAQEQVLEQSPSSAGSAVASTSKLEGLNVKFTLNEYLKAMTMAGMTMQKAMVVAGKFYKTHSSPADLISLTPGKLKSQGIDDKDILKSMATLSKKLKSGTLTDSYLSTPSPKKRRRTDIEGDSKTLSAKQRRMRQAELEDDIHWEVLEDTSLLFEKFVIINRAPVMAAWASLVLQRLGFSWEEALSIGSVYTSMNANSKAVSLGLELPSAPVVGTSQPTVQIMGRSVPVLSMVNATSEIEGIGLKDEYSPSKIKQTTIYRGISPVDGSTVSPKAAWAYIRKSFAQQTSHVLTAMKMTVDSWPPDLLKTRAYDMYIQFRPDTEWGKRARMNCQDILDRAYKQSVKDEGMTNVMTVVKSE